MNRAGSIAICLLISGFQGKRASFPLIQAEIMQVVILVISGFSSYSVYFPLIVAEKEPTTHFPISGFQGKRASFPLIQAGNIQAVRLVISGFSSYSVCFPLITCPDNMPGGMQLMVIALGLSLDPG